MNGTERNERHTHTHKRNSQSGNVGLKKNPVKLARRMLIITRSAIVFFFASKDDDDIQQESFHYGDGGAAKKNDTTPSTILTARWRPWTTTTTTTATKRNRKQERRDNRQQVLHQRQPSIDYGEETGNEPNETAGGYLEHTSESRRHALKTKQNKTKSKKNKLNETPQMGRTFQKNERRSMNNGKAHGSADRPLPKGDEGHRYDSTKLRSII